MFENKINMYQKLRSFSKTVILLFAMLLPVVAWAHENGIYTVSNEVSHDNPVGQGMARSYTEAISDVEITDSGTFVTLAFNNTQYMGEFSLSVNGSSVSYEQSSAGNNIKKLRFQVPDLNARITVGLFVIPMDTNVEYTVTFNEGSLKLIQAEEIKVVEEAVTQVEEQVTDTKQEKQSSAVSENATTSTPTTNETQSAPAPTQEVQVSEEKQSESMANQNTVEVKTTEAKETKTTEEKKAVDNNSVQEKNIEETKTTNQEKTQDEQKTREKVATETESNSKETEEKSSEKVSESTTAIVGEEKETEKEADVVEGIKEEIDTIEDKEQEMLESEETMATSDSQVGEESNGINILPIVGIILIVGAIIGYVVYKKKK